MVEQTEEMLKSSYNLEFLDLRRAVKERELEDRLISRLQAFLLELGYGFCFVGRQHWLALGEKEYFVDLLFEDVTTIRYMGRGGMPWLTRVETFTN